MAQCERFNLQIENDFQPFEFAESGLQTGAHVAPTQSGFAKGQAHENIAGHHKHLLLGAYQASPSQT